MQADQYVQFTLVVDDFGIKYVCQDHLNHLIKALKKFYEVSVDESGSLYCGITLKWDYDKRILDISMPEYVIKQNTNTRSQRNHNIARGSPIQLIMVKNRKRLTKQTLPPHSTRTE